MRLITFIFIITSSYRTRHTHKMNRIGNEKMVTVQLRYIKHRTEFISLETNCIQMYTVTIFV